MFQVYQSILSIWPSTTKDDWGTLLWPGSHETVFPELMGIVDACDPSGVGLGHFVSLSQVRDVKPDLQDLFISHSKRICLPAGSLLIWDSRTVHQGCRSNVGRRLAMPICWEPAARRSPSALLRKMLIASSGRPSTHWASFGNMHGAQQVSSQTHVPVPARDYGIGTDGKRRVRLAIKGTLKPVPLRGDLAAEDGNETNPLIRAMLDKLDKYEGTYVANRGTNAQYSSLLSGADMLVLQSLLNPEFDGVSDANIL